MSRRFRPTRIARRMARRAARRWWRRAAYTAGCGTILAAVAHGAGLPMPGVGLPAVRLPDIALPAPAAPSVPAPAASPAAGGDLAALTVDDHPNPGGYRRDLFMPSGRWQDPDRNGCDARRDALRSQSTPPVTGAGCSTSGGRWPLVYVPGDTTRPADVDVDHVVPLANAWRSGARDWSADRAVAYAADPAVLWVVDDAANQAKGDKGPEEWRPAQRGVWCAYARRWVQIKAVYGLTVTTRERDALGQMMETCP